MQPLNPVSAGHDLSMRQRALVLALLHREVLASYPGRPSAPEHVTPLRRRVRKRQQRVAAHA
jgi:hypothetical protein